ncbi:tyrosine-type recombinase/integrase [Acetobacter thailandicus]|uniref:Site-specific integrase n=1 Tax=Acetobacter thailandicus TaxID=1502842 RepID=A0ABT3QEK5_9PROT|nr:site-specific integrase [Acetobacter thailandicus]MCX2563696.1 site-specific integrase [Acetobacter thailandicus]NHN95232.1 tyrosine-type recombinase/integrase [Acetobacter thailandicus]
MSEATSKPENRDPATGRTLPKGIYYRAPKQYQARKQIDGKRVIKTFESAAIAKRWINEKSAEAELGLFRDTSPLDKHTVESLVSRFRDDNMQNRTTDRIGHVPAILRDEIAQTRLSKLNSGDVRKFRDRMLESGLAPSTCVKRLNLLASIIQHAISEWDIPLTQNPASGRIVKRPAGADKKRNRRLNDVNAEKSEYNRLIECMADSVCLDDIWLVKWSIEQACRRGESLSLRWCDIDLDGKTISLARTKNEKHREEHGPEKRPLMPGARRLLIEKLASYEHEPKPTDKIFNVGTEDAFSVRYGRYVKKAGLKDLTFHDLRHEATSRLAKIFTNPLDLCRVTGHRDLKSLDRYYQPILEDLANFAEEQEKILRIAYKEE